MKLIEENKTFLKKVRRWIIVQKYTLQRGYGHLNVLMLGVVCAASIKSAFPGAIDNFIKFIGLSILGFIGLYIVGWFDKKWRFLHEEQCYTTETNDLLMEVINANRQKQKNQNE
jgi:purine-cytosine permease-like protein